MTRWSDFKARLIDELGIHNDEPTTRLLTGEDWLTQADDYHDAHLDITQPIPKVSPNVDHTPPPPPAHNCISLEAYRDQVAGEHHTAHADAYREFADWLPAWWATRLRDAR